jgi:hypothetical protein
MASNESIFDKLNLSSAERRLVMAVLVVLMLALAWMVWGMIPSPGVTQNKIANAQKALNSFTNEISKISDYEKKIRTLEGLGSEVKKIDQEVNMRRAINNLTAANGVRVTRTGRMTTKTNDFFLEKTLRIDFSSKESDIVNFLWKLGGNDSMVRVSEMRVRPDKNRFKLDGWMNLTASYQKNLKVARVQPPAQADENKSSASKPKTATETKPAIEDKAKSGAAKPEPANPAVEPKPAKRTVPKRSVPTRRTRKTQ